MTIEAEEVRSMAGELLDADAHDRLGAMRHSTAHMMAAAVLELFPGARLGIGPAIADGFYYDFEVDRPFTPEDLERIEARMHEIVDRDEPIVREVWERDRAVAFGHTHRPIDNYRLKNVTFHNCGAPIGKGSFRIVTRDVVLSDQPHNGHATV
jgi:threonyl-tRNA synthetase